MYIFRGIIRKAGEDLYSVIDTHDGVINNVDVNTIGKYLKAGTTIFGLELLNKTVYVRTNGMYKHLYEYSFSINKPRKIGKSYLGILNEDSGYKTFVIDTDEGFIRFKNNVNIECRSGRNGFDNYEDYSICDSLQLSENEHLVATVGNVCVKYDIEFYLTGFDLYLVDVSNMLCKTLLKQSEVIYLNEIYNEEEFGGDCPSGKENLSSISKKPFGKIVKKGNEISFNGVIVDLKRGRTYGIKDILNGNW